MHHGGGVKDGGPNVGHLGYSENQAFCIRDRESESQAMGGE